MYRTLIAVGIAASAWVAPMEAAMAETLMLSVKDAAMTEDGQTGRPALQIHLDPQSAKAFGEMTIRHLSSVVEVLLDGKILIAPRVQSPIVEGSLQIVGDFSEAEIAAMVERINSGAQLEVRAAQE